jgi:hypothetical protein
MNALAFLRTALPVCVAVIGLTGCALPPAATPPATPAIAVQPDANAKSSLLYISNGAGNVAVYRYWKRSFVGLLSGFKAPKGECVDADGNVFITDSGSAKIREYAHGGTKPIRVLEDRGYQPYSCSVDPTNGNLAVANNLTTARGEGGIAIYRNARGKPKFYGPIQYLPNPVAVGYDGEGNLLIASLLQYTSYYEYATFALLPKGQQSFVRVRLSEISSGSPFEDVTDVQWDGQYWAIAYNGEIFRYAIANDGESTLEGVLSLSSLGYGQAQFWIYTTTAGSQIVGASPSSNTVYYWHYPAGGAAIASVTSYLNEPYGVTVSPRSATKGSR